MSSRGKYLTCIRFVSGGQTGVDRAVLDAVLGAGYPAGGWCPEGRLAEDGMIANKYPLDELPGGGYAERTRQNVLDSDGTVIIGFGRPTGGTELTLRCCQIAGKPCTVINAEQMNAEHSAEQVLNFIREQAIRVLNIAGPRASEKPQAYAYTLAVMQHVFESTGMSRGDAAL